MRESDLERGKRGKKGKNLSGADTGFHLGGVDFGARSAPKIFSILPPPNAISTPPKTYFLPPPIRFLPPPNRIFYPLQTPFLPPPNACSTLSKSELRGEGHTIHLH